MTVRLLAVAASLRHGSLNRKLLGNAVVAARGAGAEVVEAGFAEFDVPAFNADVQEASGFPAGAVHFRERLEAADGLLLASPEYNYSMPGTLKNLIDWVSRMRPVPFRGRSALLLATSNGPIGGIRGLWQLRIPLEGLGMFVHPDMFSLPAGGQAFGEDGRLADPKVAERLQRMVEGYVRAARALAARS